MTGEGGGIKTPFPPRLKIRGGSCATPDYDYMPLKGCSFDHPFATYYFSRENFAAVDEKLVPQYILNCSV